VNVPEKPVVARACSDKRGTNLIAACSSCDTPSFVDVDIALVKTVYAA
jgi:hypothetical protein